MSEAKDAVGFTPGPYTVEKKVTWGWCVMAGKKYLAWNLKRKSQAQLFAAAPELLEALTSVKVTIENNENWWIDCPDKGGFDLEKILAAIAKATNP